LNRVVNEVVAGKGVIAGTIEPKAALGVVLDRARLEDVPIATLREREAPGVVIGCVSFEGVPKRHCKHETLSIIANIDIAIVVAVGCVIQEGIVVRRLYDEAPPKVLVDRVIQQSAPIAIIEE
jgi:hypothetical protein